MPKPLIFFPVEVLRFWNPTFFVNPYDGIVSALEQAGSGAEWLTAKEPGVCFFFFHYYQLFPFLKPLLSASLAYKLMPSLDYDIFTQAGERGWIGNWHNFSTSVPRGMTRRWTMKLRGYPKTSILWLHVRIRVDSCWERKGSFIQAYLLFIVSDDFSPFDSSSWMASWWSTIGPVNLNDVGTISSIMVRRKREVQYIPSESRYYQTWDFCSVLQCSWSRWWRRRGKCYWLVCYFLMDLEALLTEGRYDRLATQAFVLGVLKFETLRNYFKRLLI
jgi:hypothetical protein